MMTGGSSLSSLKLIQSAKLLNFSAEKNHFVLILYCILDMFQQ